VLEQEQWTLQEGEAPGVHAQEGGQQSQHHERAQPSALGARWLGVQKNAIDAKDDGKLENAGTSAETKGKDTQAYCSQ